MDRIKDEPMSQEQVISEIKRISAILNGDKNDEYYLTCERFIGEKNFIREYKSMIQLQRLNQYYGLLESEASEPMQYFQINYCVICSLEDNQFADFEQGIREARARRSGFESYEEKFELTKVLANRMARIFNLNQSDSYSQIKIASDFSERHSAMFIGINYLGIDQNLPLEELCHALLMEIDKKQIEEVIITSIEIAESEYMEV